MDFIYQLGGIETVEGDIRVRFRNPEGEIEYTPAAIAVSARVALDHTIFAEDFRFLAGIVDDGVTPKLTIPSPNMVHYRGGRAALNPAVYADVEPFWSDLAAAYRRPGAGRGRTGLHLPAARRHQPGLPQRSRLSGRPWSSAARTPRTCMRPT